METTEAKLERLKSFLSFVQFWINVKVTSEHGFEINRQILKSTKWQIGQLERKLKVEKVGRNILVVVENSFESERIFRSTMDRFVSTNDLIFASDKANNTLISEYTKNSGIKYTEYDAQGEIPDTVDYGIVFINPESRLADGARELFANANRPLIMVQR